MPQRFCWTTFDVASVLPEDWHDDISAVTAEAEFRDYPRTPVLSREAADVSHITRGRVHADKVQQHLPWLYKLYRNDFAELAARARAESIEAAVDDRYGVVLNVQKGTAMRFECHVDSNPVTGLLFLSDHPAGGGELVVSHDPAAVGVDGLERDCSLIRPQAGQFIVFDGKTYPHYARAVSAEPDVRVVAVMNFYTRTCPESTRPVELNRHLFGDQDPSLASANGYHR
jgi:hypothetical protein